MPLRALITFAYQLQPFQLVNDPSWLRTTNFDIVAKMEGDPAPVPPGAAADPLMLAMRSLLAERFKLTVHRETREMDIYALVMARPDGKPGPALKPSTQDCAAMMAAARGGPPPGPPPGPNSPVMCGMRATFGRIQAGGMPMMTFANNLQDASSARSWIAQGWQATGTSRSISHRTQRLLRCRQASICPQVIPPLRRFSLRFRSSWV